MALCYALAQALDLHQRDEEWVGYTTASSVCYPEHLFNRVIAKKQTKNAQISVGDDCTMC